VEISQEGAIYSMLRIEGVAMEAEVLSGLNRDDEGLEPLVYTGEYFNQRRRRRRRCNVLDHLRMGETRINVDVITCNQNQDRRNALVPE